MSKEEIKIWVKNYLYYEIIRNQDRWIGQERYHITIIDLIKGIIWFPFFVLKKVMRNLEKRVIKFLLKSND